MPRPGVEGRGGDAGRVLRSEGKEANDTGEVGRDTVMGMEFAAPVRVKPLLSLVPTLRWSLLQGQGLVCACAGAQAMAELPGLVCLTPLSLPWQRLVGP